MTSIAEVSNSINYFVKLLGEAAWELDNSCGLLEESRKLHQYLRRVEAFISDIKPYLRGVRAWGSLRDVEGTLSSLLQEVLEAARKGPVVQYLQADRILKRFTTAAAHLDAALGHLHDVASESPDDRSSRGRPSDYSVSRCGPSSSGATGFFSNEIQAELRDVRGLLRSAEFTLPAGHLANLQRFRKACDGLHEHFKNMMLSYSDIMEHTKQGQLLSKESFRALINELQTEVEVLQQQMLQAMHLRCSKALCSGACECRSGTWRGRAHPLHGSTQPEMERAEQSASEQHYLRMLMDAVRASHVNTDCEAPLDFLCPLTHQLMQDPVLLHETGHSYERKALEEWWASGHHFCPRTGLHLRRLNTSPNHNLRSAIERWQLCSDMHLSFKPVLNTLISQHQQQLNHEKATLCFPQKARFIHRVQTPTQDGSQQNISFIKGHEQDANPRRTPFPGSLGNSPFDLCGDGATMQHEQQPPQIGRAAPVAGALALVSAAPVEHSCRSTDGWNLCKGCAKGVRYIESEAVCEGTGECSLYANPPQHRSSQDPGLIGDASGSGDGMATAASAGMVVERLKSCGAADTVMRQLSGP